MAQNHALLQTLFSCSTSIRPWTILRTDLNERNDRYEYGYVSVLGHDVSVGLHPVVTHERLSHGDVCHPASEPLSQLVSHLTHVFSHVHLFICSRVAHHLNKTPAIFIVNLKVSIYICQLKKNTGEFMVSATKIGGKTKVLVQDAF